MLHSTPYGGDVKAYTCLYTPVTRKKDFFCNFRNRGRFVMAKGS